MALGILAGLLALFIPLRAEAYLVDRGGGLIYDDVLDITWLQNANLPQASGVDADGLMNAFEAVAWADSLVYQGYSDWRLPSARNFDGSDPDYGWRQKTNEMGRLYYDELGNQATMDVFDLSGLDSAGPFLNLEPFRYWSGTSYYMTPDFHWYFNFGSGYQWDGYSLGQAHAWAVRDGDSRPKAVPLPGTLLLMASALAGAALWRAHHRLE